MSRKNKHQVILEKAAQLASRGMFTPAINRYRSVLKIYPDQIELWLQLANCLGLSGQRAEAELIHEQLKNSVASPDLLTRIARDTEEWQDFKRAIDTWDAIILHPKSQSRHKNEGAFHKTRLLERMNHVAESKEQFHRSKSQHDESWGWKWVEGKLAERSGDYTEAKECYETALKKSPSSLKAKCASALARLVDKTMDYEQAYDWLEKTIEFRADESQSYQARFPIVPAEFASVEKSAQIYEHKSPIFLAGYPRSGTTLLARRLSEQFQLGLSEEYNFLKQLVDESSFYPRQIPLQRLAKKNVKAEVANYWKAQSEIMKGEEASYPLLDKNPSFSALLPWLLTIFPKMKVIWLERDVRDLWLSSSMLDVPMNGMTCWWQDFNAYEQWHQSFSFIKNHYKNELPTTQFMVVEYNDLVNNPQSKLEEIQDSFSLISRDSQKQSSDIITSPSYEEAIKPITATRLDRWQSYFPYLSDDLKRKFDTL